MERGPTLRTPRLLMRRWHGQDLEPFAAMNADPAVMEHFPSTHSREQSAALIERIERDFERQGFGFWAIELRGEAPLIGFVGISRVGEQYPFAPAVEIAWRLARPYWGRGLAFEAATEAMRYGFDTVGLAAILAFTARANTRSLDLMVRLGMTRDAAEDFRHPSLPAAHPLAEHVLFRREHRPPDGAR